MITISAMTEAYVPAAAQLERECFSEPWSEASIRSELENPLSLWLIASEGGRLCGYVGSQTVIDASDMMNIAVAPAFRRQGIGRMLVEELCRSLAGRGSTSLTLEVRASNEPAKALYASLGFTEAGRRPGYYSRPKEDALILRKEWQL